MNFDYNLKLHETFTDEETQRQLKELLELEADFLPSPAKLRQMVRRKKWSRSTLHSDTPSTIEAMIEIRHLTDICLHYRRWYYRTDKEPLADNYYDALENRLKYLGKLYPDLIGDNHPVMHENGY